MTHDGKLVRIHYDALALADALHGCAKTNFLIPAPRDQLSLGSAYATQERVFEKRGAELAGWKLGLTSEAAQKEMRLSSPIIGRLAASDVVCAERKVESAPGVMYAEAELAVTLHSDLPARSEPYSRNEVVSAIGEVHAAIELCTSRFVDDGVEAAALIADNAFAYRLVLGRTLAMGWNAELASLPVTLDSSAGWSIHGSTAAVMGNPIDAVTWLANWLSSLGQGLNRRQIVATGSCTGVTRVHVGETLRASFAGTEGAAVTIIPPKGLRRFE